MKKLNVTVGRKDYPIVDLTIEEEITPSKKVYRSRDQVMYDELSASSAKYYHPMFSLTPKEQRKRVYNLSYELIG